MWIKDIMIICIKTRIKDEQECCYVDVSDKDIIKLDAVKQEWFNHIKDIDDVQYITDIFLDMMKSNNIEFKVINADMFICYEKD